MSILDNWQNQLGKFIWAGKNARIKNKCLCDLKERGGLQLPNLKIYQEAVSLSWIQEWLNLEKPELLNLEGFSNVFSWHAYLNYEKQTVDRFFSSPLY